jgi:hypothetical protein
MDEGSYAVLQIILLAVRIGITVYCVNKAGELNRSKGGWGVFGFFLPIIALIWIQFMKPKMVWDDQSGKNE